MKQHFYIKLGFILTLILALMIPRAFISALIGERQGWRQQAYDGIRQSWPGAQTLAGPILSIPYQLTCNAKEKIIKTNKTEQEIVKEVTASDRLIVMPKQLQINARLDASKRYRGIYQVPVYTSILGVNGEFDSNAMPEFEARHKDCKILWDKPQLSVLVMDQRGIAKPVKLTVNTATLPFFPGGYLSGTVAGMHAQLSDINDRQEIRFPFSFEMELRGMQGLSFALLSENTDLRLKANWPHPRFTGELLPDQREIFNDGFTALWRASSFSYDVTAALENCRRGNCRDLLSRSVGFDLIQPVDIYQLSERSIKYSELFIVLTFVVLLLFELLKKLKVHPVQYTLVGAALLMFYLLLISLSEHIRFVHAYALGASGCTFLLTLYFGAILRSGKLGLLLGSGLSILYLLLYVILQAEESALLMGSALLFTVLAGLMLSTRHFDWYALTGQGENAEKSETAGFEADAKA